MTHCSLFSGTGPDGPGSMAETHLPAAATTDGDLLPSEARKDSANTGAELDAQRQVWTEQCEHLLTLRQQQLQLTGSDPLQEEANASGTRATDPTGMRKTESLLSSPVKGQEA